MNQASQTMTGDGATNSSPARTVRRVLLWICPIAAAVFVGNTYLEMRSAQAERVGIADSNVRSAGLVSTPAKHLASEFTDGQGRLLADPPASGDKLLDPPTLVMARLEASDPEAPGIPWVQFEKHLSEAVGRKVEDLIYDNGPAQLAQIKAGAITLVALHAADAPFLVNNYGFQPVAVMGDSDGTINGNHMDLIVPAKSSLFHAADLRGHTLTCTVPSSITGYRAAIALLMQNEGLRPNVDYLVTFAMKQKLAIQGVASNKLEAAAVSDEKLQSLLKKGTVNATSYRTIYQSEVIPRMTIGWFYNLKPELAAKVREAILSFRPEGAMIGAGESSASGDGADLGGKPLHFVPVNYKNDFSLVRRIDDSFDPRLDSKKPKKSPE